MPQHKATTATPASTTGVNNVVTVVSGLCNDALCTVIALASDALANAMPANCPALWLWCDDGR